MPPLVTALLPVKHFHPGYLDEAIRSIAGQTCPDWRLLIIAEDVPRLTAHLASWLRDPRITIVPTEGRKLAGKFNTGMRRATTDFVAILLGDDAWEPNTVEILTQSIARSPHVDFFHSSRIIIDDRGVPISSVYRSRDHFEVADFLRSSPVKHLLCWRRSKGLEIGGMDESLNSVGPDDYDFPWLMAERGAVFQAIPDCLYRHRDHRNGFRLTTHLPLSTHLLEMTRIFRKHGATTGQIVRKLRRARRSYLRQCLYWTPLDKWVRERLGLTPSGWRETYR